MPSWLSDLVGTDMARPAYYALAATIVLVLIFLVLWIARKVLGASSGPRVKGRGPRLAIMDVAAIDPKRKLILVRRDEVEHLLLVGGQNDIVVEAGILRVPASARTARVDPALRPEPESRDVAAERTPTTTAAAAMQPPMRRAAPPQPSVTAPLDTRPQRMADPRTKSPLARQVPRPAPPRSAPSGGNEPVVDLGDAVAPGREEESRDVSTIETSAGARVGEPEGTGREPEIARAPLLQAADAPAERQRVDPEIPPVATPAPIVVDRVEPSRQEPISTAMEAPPSPATPQAAAMPIRPPASGDGPSAIPEPSAGRPLRPGNGVPMEPARPAASIGRVPAGIGGSEPPRRQLPVQTVQPIQPRSMATPTFQARPPSPPADAMDGPAPSPVGPASGDKEPNVAAPSRPLEPAVPRVTPPDRGSMLAGLLGTTPSPAATPEKREPTPIAAPQPVPSNASGDDAGELRNAATGPAGPVGAGTAPTGNEDGDEKRPLSVRSFATAIQARRSLQDPLPEPPARDVRAPQRRVEDLVGPSVQTATMIAPMVVAVPTVSEVPISMDPAPTPASARSDEGTELEEFLTAQLDSDFGNESGSAKDAGRSSAPEVVPEVRPGSTGAAAEPEKVLTPRQLTLEEEMERLLGDFDFETSDRKQL